MSKTTTRLTGSDLLAAVETMGPSASRQQLCEATGYVKVTTTGKTQIVYNTFLNAVLEAKGMVLPASQSAGGPRPSFSTSTLGNGNVVVGRCYAKALGAEKGDTWSIQVDPGTKSITLKLA